MKNKDIDVLEKNLINIRNKIINNDNVIEYPHVKALFDDVDIKNNLIKFFYIVLKQINNSNHINYFPEIYNKRIQFPIEKYIGNNINIKNLDITEIPRYGTNCTLLHRSIKCYDLIYEITEEEFIRLYNTALFRKIELVKKGMFKTVYPSILSIINDGE